MREIILDTETTGLNPKEGHRIVEIGAVEMINKIVTDKKFHYYLNPERTVPIEAYNIHGISSKFLENKPLFKDVVTDFLAFIQNSRLVIHNANFDLSFLNYELSIIGMKALNYLEVTDTLALARTLFPGSKVNLDALCKRFKINYHSLRKYHSALNDAKLLAQVYIELSGGRQVSFLIKSNEGNDIKNIVYKKVVGNNIIITPTKEEEILYKKFLASFNC